LFKYGGQVEGLASDEHGLDHRMLLIITRGAVLIRLIDLAKADWDLYRLRKIELDQRYLEFRLDQKRQRREQEGGPSYYTVKARDLGHRYIGSVLEAYHGRFISSLDVADYLSVRYEQLPKLQEALRR
jgi:hypothetical protein